MIEKELDYTHEMEGCTWHPEFGGWMIESTPSRPYSKFASDLLRVERNMIVRRRRLLSLLLPDEIAPYVCLIYHTFILSPFYVTPPASSSDDLLPSSGSRRFCQGPSALRSSTLQVRVYP